ncbi:hypothetical protein AX15_003697 [Amanita polypyramis BW_CC]|nr:hypothetical protein AX15_003697 [Amanita polypyramis BW_CC]
MAHPDRAHNASYDAAPRTYTDFFSGHAQTSLLDQSFTPDQSRSLQKIFMAYHAFVFRCIYDMETHLESSLEELRDQQNSTEDNVAKLRLTIENVRCNMLAIARRLDDRHGPGKPYDSGGKDSLSSVRHGYTNDTNGYGAKRRDSNFWSLEYSDTSTLRSTPHERLRKPFISTPTSTISPVLLHRPTDTARDLNIDPDSDTAFHATPASAIRNFGSLPSISSTISPAIWTSTPIASGELYPSPDSDGNDMQDLMHSQASYSGDSSDEEEIVAMQLFVDTHSLSPVHPSPRSPPNIEFPTHTETDTQNPAHTDTGMYLHPQPPPPLPHSSPTGPTPPPDRPILMPSPPLVSPQAPSLSRSDGQIQIHALLDNQIQLQAQTQAQLHGSETPLESELTPISTPKLEPLGLPLALTPGSGEAAQSQSQSQPQSQRQSQVQARPSYFFNDLIIPLSPLSELTDMSLDEEASQSLTASSSLRESNNGDERYDDNRERISEEGRKGGVKRESTDQYQDEPDSHSHSDLPLLMLPSRSDPVQRLQEKLVASSASASVATHVKKRQLTKKWPVGEEGKRKRAAVRTLMVAEKRNVKEKVKEALRLQKAAVQKNKNNLKLKKGEGKRRMRSRKVKVEWPVMYEGDEEDGFYCKLIECDMCSCWYHYDCAGITPDDVRLGRSEIYTCPVCSTLGESQYLCFHFTRSP